MNNCGYIKLHRKIRESAIGSEPAVAWTFILVLMAVNWKAGWFKMEQRVEPGQMIFSYSRIRDRLFGAAPEDGPDNRPSKNAIIRYLKKMESARMIRLEPKPNQYTILTVINWERYQSDDDSGVPEMGTPPGTPVGTPPGTDRRRFKKGKKKEFLSKQKTEHDYGPGVKLPNRNGRAAQ